MRDDEFFLSVRIDLRDVVREELQLGIGNEIIQDIYQAQNSKNYSVFLSLSADFQLFLDARRRLKVAFVELDAFSNYDLEVSTLMHTLSSFRSGLNWRATKEQLWQRQICSR